MLWRLSLLERDDSGRLMQVSCAVSTGQQASGLYLRNYHTEMMERAVRAMHEIAAEDRYVSALTLSASPAAAREVKRRVMEFRRDLVALCDADPEPSRIVQLNLQLFPLSRQFGEPTEQTTQKKQPKQ